MYTSRTCAQCIGIELRAFLAAGSERRKTAFTALRGLTRHTRQHPPTHRGTGARGQFERRERTTAAIRTTQYSTVRSVTRTTGYTPASLAGAHASARSGPQTVTQRRRGLAYTRARTRSLVALDGGSDALDARRPAARLPAALAEQLVDREVPGLGGETQRAAPMPTALSGRRGRAAMGRTSRHRVADGGLVVRISTCHRVDLVRVRH